MRLHIPLLAILLSTVQLSAQENNSVSTPTLAGLLRTQLTITPAWSITGTSGENSSSIAGGRTNVYLHGTAEYYFTERFSARGDGYYFLNKNKVDGGIKYNHAIQVGASWHLLKNATIDPFIGVRAGLNVAQVYPMDLTNGAGATWEDYKIPAHIDPVWGPHVGVNFFGQRIFHFFIEAHYLVGNYTPAAGPSRSLNELRVSAGLGWNWVFAHKEGTVRGKI
jgi:hypothetical protein